MASRSGSTAPGTGFDFAQAGIPKDQAEALLRACLLGLPWKFWRLYLGEDIMTILKWLQLNTVLTTQATECKGYNRVSRCEPGPEPLAILGYCLYSWVLHRATLSREFIDKIFYNNWERDVFGIWDPDVDFNLLDGSSSGNERLEWVHDMQTRFLFPGEDVNTQLDSPQRLFRDKVLGIQVTRCSADELSWTIPGLVLDQGPVALEQEMSRLTGQGGPGQFAAILAGGAAGTQLGSADEPHQRGRELDLEVGKDPSNVTSARIEHMQNAGDAGEHQNVAVADTSGTPIAALGVKSNREAEPRGKIMAEDTGMRSHHSTSVYVETGTTVENLDGDAEMPDASAIPGGSGPQVQAAGAVLHGECSARNAENDTRRSEYEKLESTHTFPEHRVAEPFNSIREDIQQIPEVAKLLLETQPEQKHKGSSAAVKGREKQIQDISAELEGQAELIRENRTELENQAEQIRENRTKLEEQAGQIRDNRIRLEEQKSSMTRFKASVEASIMADVEASLRSKLEIKEKELERKYTASLLEKENERMAYFVDRLTADLEQRRRLTLADINSNIASASSRITKKETRLDDRFGKKEKQLIADIEQHFAAQAEKHRVGAEEQIKKCFGEQARELERRINKCLGEQEQKLEERNQREDHLADRVEISTTASFNRNKKAFFDEMADRHHDQKNELATSINSYFAGKLATWAKEINDKFRGTNRRLAKNEGQIRALLTGAEPCPRDLEENQNNPEASHASPTKRVAKPEDGQEEPVREDQDVEKRPAVIENGD